MGRAVVASLKTRDIQAPADLVAHFDRHAADYVESHGDARALLEYRVSLIRPCFSGRRGVFLEIGCGPAIHLLALAPDFDRLIGTDISPAMIDSARRAAAASPHAARIDLRVDAAERLATVDDACVDVALCVGALEHMLDKAAVVRQVARVLKPQGRFVLLTPNGGYLWYSTLAPALRIPTRHLSTDRFLRAAEAADLLRSAGMTILDRAYWTFIPKGDMPRWAAAALQALDRLGRLCRIGALRGGILLTAVKND